ncbi:class I SAM-dependent methyltransferase [Phormidium pseudopriestleyi FRX01]|uniref:Class I SAM-dependent methyltransferase n=1 Tax=Phormidium pseudopriestleyi FRX01 TaxID=1759528 RepID=A0ABS3FTX8_9CYAN|nr:CmcI family methyltransferase [Phormidium pseudopriestleyi]MBO0350583.1 class I SAM-dependent methyltransferase [Phormidium pseudopriestleyi FRX01]
MKLIIDTSEKTLTQEIDGQQVCLDLYSKEAFELISQQWVKVGWNQKYPYTFSWMGRPIIQLPEDMIRIQEAIYQVQPDVIIETGVAHGGSLIYYASLCKAIAQGRVIGIDIEIRPHNRKAIEAHELFPYITLVEGNSIEPELVHQVKSTVKPGETVMVILDSCHTKMHVLAELEAYCDLVTPGSYLVVTDGIMQELSDVPRGQADWSFDNPTAAAAEFAQQHPEFLLEQPEWLFNESELTENVTHWPGAWLQRKESI